MLLHKPGRLKSIDLWFQILAHRQASSWRRNVSTQNQSFYNLLHRGCLQQYSLQFHKSYLKYPPLNAHLLVHVYDACKPLLAGHSSHHHTREDACEYQSCFPLPFSGRVQSIWSSMNVESLLPL